MGAIPLLPTLSSNSAGHVLLGPAPRVSYHQQAATRQILIVVPRRAGREGPAEPLNPALGSSKAMIVLATGRTAGTAKSHNYRVSQLAR